MTDSSHQHFHSTVIPYLAFQDTSRAIEFYQHAFNAVEVYRLNDPDGKISHAEIRIGDTPIFLSDEYPEIDVLSPKTIGGSPVMIVLEVEHVDAVLQQALAAGAVLVRPLQDGFDGTLRTCKVNDPFGHRWMILTHQAKREIQ
jgi:PhnB protein